MFEILIALSLLQQPDPAAAQTGPGWQVAGTEDGCVAHSAYRGGTVLTVFALPAHDGIGFLLQNTSWTDLREGAVYPLEIRFEDGSHWSMEAVARREIDRDGPGLFFAVRPGAGDSGRDFMVEFAAARDMRIAHDGAAIETLALSGNHDATVALAQCLSRLMGGGASPFGDSKSEPPVRI